MRPYLIIAILAVWFSASTHAEDWSLSTFSHGPRSSVAYEVSGIARQPVRWREAQVRRRHRPEPRRLYRSHDHQPPAKRQCLDRVTVVGSQWANEAGAEESAQKAFMELVRWEHGEQFMDVANAEGYAKRCSRSSVGEVLNQTFHRCQVSARPCRPEIEMGAGK